MASTATLSRKVARVVPVRDRATLRTTRARVPGYLSMIRCSHRSVWNDFPVPAGPLMMTLSVVRKSSFMGPRICVRTRVLVIPEVDFVAHATADFYLLGAVEPEVLGFAICEADPCGDGVLVACDDACHYPVDAVADLVEAEVDDGLPVAWRERGAEQIGRAHG